jgi:hypothetical protein
VGGLPAGGGQGAEGTPLLPLLDARVHGCAVVLEAVRYRKGQRHRVFLHLAWQPKWGEWLLQRYEERPDPL